MKTFKFDNHPAAAYEIHQYDNGKLELQSYRTIVLTVDHDGWLHVNGLYSATTRKHIGWFMRWLGLDYQTAKACYEHDGYFNIYTGEILNWD